MKKKLSKLALMMAFILPLSLTGQVLDPPEPSSCNAKWTGEECNAQEYGKCLIICYPE
jgi:hypothetical protein